MEELVSLVNPFYNYQFIKLELICGSTSYFIQFQYNSNTMHKLYVSPIFFIVIQAMTTITEIEVQFLCYFMGFYFIKQEKTAKIKKRTKKKDIE